MFERLTITFLIIITLLPWQGLVAQCCGNDALMTCCAAGVATDDCGSSGGCGSAGQTGRDRDPLFTISIDLCDDAELCSCDDGRSRVPSSLPAGGWSGHDGAQIRHLVLKPSVSTTLRRLCIPLPKPLDRSGTYIQQHSFRI